MKQEICFKKWFDYTRKGTQENINACNDKIEAVTGVRPTLFRPPYGEYDDNVVLATRDLGMEPIQWDVEHLETEETYCSAMGFRFYSLSFHLQTM